MAESEEPKTTCKFLFKKSNKTFSARKRNASDSDKGIYRIIFFMGSQLGMFGLGSFMQSVRLVSVHYQHVRAAHSVLNQRVFVHQTEAAARRAVLWSERRKRLWRTP